MCACAWYRYLLCIAKPATSAVCSHYVCVVGSNRRLVAKTISLVNFTMFERFGDCLVFVCDVRVECVTGVEVGGVCCVCLSHLVCRPMYSEQSNNLIHFEEWLNIVHKFSGISPVEGTYAVAAWWSRRFAHKYNVSATLSLAANHILFGENPIPCSDILQCTTTSHLSFAYQLSHPIQFNGRYYVHRASHNNKWFVFS